MKTYRSMVLVSNDPLSIERGSQQVYTRLAEEIAALRGITPDAVAAATTDNFFRLFSLPKASLFNEK